VVPPHRSQTATTTAINPRHWFYYVLPPSHLPTPFWCPTDIGSVAWPMRKGKKWRSVSKQQLVALLDTDPTCDDQLVRMKLTAPGGSASPLELLDDHQREVVVVEERDLLSNMQAHNKASLPHALHVRCTPPSASTLAASRDPGLWQRWWLCPGRGQGRWRQRLSLTHTPPSCWTPMIMSSF
jgi:hypothetical protein